VITTYWLLGENGRIVDRHTGGKEGNAERFDI